MMAFVSELQSARNDYLDAKSAYHKAGAKAQGKNSDSSEMKAYRKAKEKYQEAGERLREINNREVAKRK